MEKFEKLRRAEMKNVMGGVMHICAITCRVSEGLPNQVVPYVYYQQTCPAPSVACDGIGEYVGCACQ